VINEWYLGNLAQELKTKLVMKARGGGTIGKAPIGYRNVRRAVDGRQVATVELDLGRAPLVRWAFETYATGDWSLTRLTEALAERGLTTVPTAHYAEKPLPRANVHRMLRHRYYLGKVIWGGIEYDGAHPALIPKSLFDRVQEVLSAHNLAGEKQRVHHHYLKGSVWCAQCGSRLCIEKVTNRHGSRYEYFFCIGRRHKRTDCAQRGMPIEVVERHIEEKWRNVQLDPEYAELLSQILRQEIRLYREEAERDLAVATRRIAILKEQRQKLLNAHYAGAVPLDQLKDEQARIQTELEAAEALRTSTQVTFEAVDTNLRRCLTFLRDSHQAYQEAGPKIRRRMNQAVFERFLVGEDGSTEAELTPLFSALLAPDLLTTKQKTKRHAREVPKAENGIHRNVEWIGGIPAWLAKLGSQLFNPGSNKPRPAFAGLGSNKDYLAERAGFEPATHLSAGTRFPDAGGWVGLCCTWGVLCCSGAV